MAKEKRERERERERGQREKEGEGERKLEKGKKLWESDGIKQVAERPVSRRRYDNHAWSQVTVLFSLAARQVSAHAMPRATRRSS